MQIRLKSYHIYIGLGVFLLMTAIGLWYQIGWSTLLMRSAIWGILSAFLTSFLEVILRQLVTVPEQEQVTPEEAELESRGQELDVVVPEDDTVLKPFTPQQIDPSIEKIINKNPEKAAEIVRKMGLDQ